MLAYAACEPGGTTPSDTAIADQVRPSMNGARMGSTVTGYNISCARTIVDTVKGHGLARRADVIAVTTAITESTLHNYTQADDHDSLGLFQQRPSQGWGTPAQLTDPIYATNAFLNAMLRKFPNNSWMTGDIGAICQAVQVSAVPDAYAREVHDAQLIVDALGNQGPSVELTRLADVDGDGRADLVSFMGPGNDLWVYRNRGYGQAEGFAGYDAGRVGVGFDPARTRLADVDGDGRADLVSFTGPGNDLWVYHNRGYGQAEVFAGYDARSVVVGFDPAR